MGSIWRLSLFVLRLSSVHVYKFACLSVQLDVKEAPKIPTEHPQWEMSDEEDESKADDDNEDVSEFTTDEDVED